MNVHYLYLFFQSNGLEIIFLFGYFKLFPTTPPYRLRNWVIGTTLINSITHPIVVFVFMKSPALNYLTAILLAELFAIATEALVYRYKMQIPWKTALNASFLANLVSWQLGPIFTTLLFLS